MADPQRRRLLDRLGTTPTVLAEGSQVVGDLIVPGGLVVSGSVRGDGQLGGALQIARGASWEGRVMAHSAVIAGALTGELLVADKLEIGSSGVIRGRVTARIVAIARGGLIDGELNVTSGEPVVTFDEKRGA
jgi:cytoskeletal protein CcmA (bactofilin family)